MRTHCAEGPRRKEERVARKEGRDHQTLELGKQQVNGRRNGTLEAVVTKSSPTGSRRAVSAKTIAKRIAYVFRPCSATMALRCLSRWTMKLTWPWRGDGTVRTKTGAKRALCEAFRRGRSQDLIST